jgi:SAM-dependent methyltransferase
LRRIIDFDYRHLPPGGGTLLDVGCGSGNFLVLAKESGWEALGVEPDSAAVAEARRKGVSVQLGGLESYAGQEGRFDVITMHHVIEHFHDPLGALRDCHRLLKPGGILWLVTPNIDSFGHARFGRLWRGLEVPRHLVLFNERSLFQALECAGFKRWHRFSAPSAHPPLVQASYAMTQGRSPDDLSVVLPIGFRIAATMKSWVERIRPARREFLFVVATK